MSDMKPGIDWIRWWSVWVVLAMVSTFIVPNPTWDRVVFALFLIAEGIAVVRKGTPDTLSEFVVWVEDRAREGTQWYKSWRALANGFVLMIAYQGGYIAALGYDNTPWSRPYLGVLVAVLLFFFLRWHWLFHKETG